MAAGDSMRRVIDIVRTPYQEVDDRLEQLSEGTATREIVRHSIGTRVFHWVLVVLMALLVWTGYAIWQGSYGPFDVGIWDGYYVAFGIHMWAAILILPVALLLFPLFHVRGDGHRQLAEARDLSIAIDIGLAFVGLRKYLKNYHAARRAWDDTTGHWLTYHPMQKTFFWWISIFTGLVAITGFGMYREMVADPATWIVYAGFLADFASLELLKQLHLFIGALIVAMILVHIYFAVLPSNWDVLKSMFTGRIRAYVVADDTVEREAGDRSGDDD